MVSQGDDVLSNARDASKKDQTLIPTLNQDQEGDRKGKKADADADFDGTVDNLLDELRSFNAEKQALDLCLDDARKELHRTPKNLAPVIAASRDFEAETDRLKRALKDLEVDKATLADANALLEAEIADLEVRLLAAAKGKNVDVLDLQKRAEFLEMKVLGLSEDLWHSMEQAEAAVKEQVKIREEREGVLQQAVEALKETKIRLERDLAGILPQIDRHLEIQGDHDAAVTTTARGLNVSRVVGAVASVGALAAAAVTVFLRSIRKR